MIRAIILVLALSTDVLAMEHYVSTLQDQHGSAIQGATVNVYVAGTSTLAPIYVNDGVTLKSNPFITGIDGVVDFYAANGVYDITYKKSGHLFNQNQYKGIALFDVGDGGGGGGGVSISQGATLPATCTPGTGPNALFLDTDAQVLHVCVATNTLTPLESSSRIGLDSHFDVSGGNVITGLSESKPLRFMDAGGTNGLEIFWHSSGKLITRCVVAGISGNCDIYPELNAGKKWGIKRASDGAVVFEVDGNTGSLTATIDCSSSTVQCTVYNTETFEMAGCQAGVAGGIWNTTAAGTPTFACDPDNSNIVGAYASFDPSIDKFVDINLRLPAGYVSGSLEFIWHWKTAGTTGTSVFCAQTGRVTTGLTSNPTLAVRSTGNGNCVSSTAQAVSLAENRVTNFNPLCTGCSGGDEIKVRLSRDAAGSVLTDSLTSAAHVIKVVARWRELQ